MGRISTLAIALAFAAAGAANAQSPPQPGWEEGWHVVRPGDTLEGLAARWLGSTTHWRELALLMSQKLRLAFIALEEMSLLPAPQRLARRLLMIAEGYGGLAVRRRSIHLAQEQLALMLSISRQTTNQILKDLETQGAVRLTYGEIEILDPERLKRAAQGKL